jgi:hypothetical protein
MRARVLAVIALCSCSDATFATQYAPTFHRDAPGISVLGVYKDGRMSSDAWNDLAPRLASVFGGKSCDAFYRDQLLSNEPALASAIDDQAREDGVTDDLAGALAPAAVADTIAFVTVLGLPAKAPSNKAVKSAPSGAAASPMRGGRGGRHGYGGGGGGGAAAEKLPPDAFEMALALYSIREHRTVGVIAMKYDGKNVDEGVSSFIAKVHAELPAATCLGWKDDVRIDPATIRALSPSR